MFQLVRYLKAICNMSTVLHLSTGKIPQRNSFWQILSKFIKFSSWKKLLNNIPTKINSPKMSQKFQLYRRPNTSWWLIQYLFSIAAWENYRLSLFTFKFPWKLLPWRSSIDANWSQKVNYWKYIKFLQINI